MRRAKTTTTAATLTSTETKHTVPSHTRKDPYQRPCIPFLPRKSSSIATHDKCIPKPQTFFSKASVVGTRFFVSSFHHNKTKSDTCKRTNFTAIMNQLLRFSTALCLGIMIVFIGLIGTDFGKTWFQSWGKQALGDAKGGTPVLFLALPILIATSLIVGLGLRTSEYDRQSVARAASGSSSASYAAVPSDTCGDSLPFSVRRCRACFGRLQRRLLVAIGLPYIHTGGGDANFNQLAWLFIVGTCAVYTTITVRRKLLSEDTTTDWKWMEVANAFGFAGLFAMSILLVPVARHSSILKIFGWNPAAAIRLHVVAGRVVVLGVLVHGGMHTWRWVGLQHKPFPVFPPGTCWRISGETDDDCYEVFRNLTGIIALLGLLAITVSSFNDFRRKCYWLFYRIHMVAGPTVLFFTILHWNRSLLYIGGGLLYYIASSFPVMLENRIQRQNNRTGTKIVSVEYIASHVPGKAARPCYALTFEASDAAMVRYRSGQYIKLLVPDISSLSHPFTVNTVPSEPNQLRVIFRVMGAFTSKLAQRLSTAIEECNDDEENAHFKEANGVPVIQALNGFLGCSDRVAQVLQHDVCVLVAGGIGITPYLSLLHRVQDCFATKQTDYLSSHRVILHWVCRDDDLIEYVKREYLDSLLSQSSSMNKASRCKRIQIFIHRTGRVDGRGSGVHPVTSYSDLTEPSEADDRKETSGTCIFPASTEGEAFRLSKFEVSSHTRYTRNIPMFVTFSVVAWSGLPIIWCFYTYVQAKHEVLSRSWSIMIIMLMALVVAKVANHAISNHEVSDEPEDASWSRLNEYQEDSLELGGFSVGDGHESDDDELELDSACASTADPSSTTTNDPTTLEERDGRPSVHQFLNCLEDAKKPGLFMCGPVPLLKELRATANDRCMSRFRKCMGVDQQIAIYEEAFHM